MELKMRAASATSLRVSGQLAKRGGSPSPMDISLETATLLDGQGRVDLKRGSIAADVRIENFPSSVADRLLGMDGYLVDMLGNVVSVRMSGRSGSQPRAAGDHSAGAALGAGALGASAEAHRGRAQA
jgi:hypothetical protein